MKIPGQPQYTIQYIHNTQEYLLNKGWCSECRFLVQNKVFPTPPPQKKKKEEFFCLKTENIGTYRDGDGTIDTKELSTVLRHIDSYTTYIVDSNFEETKVFYVNFFTEVHDCFTIFSTKIV